MPANPVDEYKKLLSKEQHENDQYVLIDAKWFELWKRFVGLDKSNEEEVTEPGPIDFTRLVDPSTVNHPDGVQLRPDALEGNDFTFIPMELYEILVERFKQNGKDIVRRVIPSQTNGYQTTIETFLVPLRLRQSQYSHATFKQIYRSRRSTVAELKRDLCRAFPQAEDSNYSLFASADEYGDSWELIDAQPSAVLADIALVKNAFIIYESERFVKPSSKGSSYTPGLCGLSNLGNTCFMNSALQCLSNVPALTRYFHNNEYREHINRDNPLGMKGDVAQAYGELIANIWSGKLNYYSPKCLKQNVANYAPQFSGYSQQDSQEFMSFLLDGLHEDLNLVKQKPYLEKKDDDRTLSDDQLALQQWDDYRQRNQSKIHDIFHGQIKSEVECLSCGTIGRTFDPICFISLPLPSTKKIRKIKIEYVRLNGEINFYSIKSNEHGCMKNLVQDFCRRFQPKEKNSGENGDEEEEEDLTPASDCDGHQPRADFILAAEVFNNRIHKQFRDDDLLTNIFERDQIVFYEVAHSLKQGNSESILMPCVFRESDRFTYNFGLPIYLDLPRLNCTGKHIQDALQSVIGKFLPLPPSDTSDQPTYTASCVFDRNYNHQTRALTAMLDETIEFYGNRTSLYVDVSSSVVRKYKDQEEDRLKSKLSTMTNGTARASQPKKPATSLLDCFKYFTTKEVLSDNDQWYCPKCKELKNASKKIDLWLLPKVLIVQLKRFNYNRYFRDKIDLLVDCPLRDLDLSQLVLNPAERAKAKYDLIAVSNHMGGLGGGHYTAYAKNSSDQRWHLFNDGFVSNLDENNVISESAYLLLYQQQVSANQ